MDAEFWHERWKNNETGWNQDQANPFLTRHWNTLGVPVGSTVFVPLCGKSKDMDWLLDAGYRVLGVELNELAVQQYFDERGSKPVVSQDDSFRTYAADGVQILVGDVFRMTPEYLLDVRAVYDRAALIALPPVTREAYVRLLRKSVPETAPTLLVTFEKAGNDTDGPPFSVDQRAVRNLFSDQSIVHLLADEPFENVDNGLREITFHLEPMPRGKS